MEAFIKLTTAGNNTLIGWDAGLNIETGGSNVVIGRGAAIVYDLRRPVPWYAG